MGFLRFANELDISKATVSVWFRVPQASMDAMKRWSAQGDFDVFNEVIPIITFGKQRYGTVTDYGPVLVGPYLNGVITGTPLYASHPSGSRSCPMSPTSIGIELYDTPEGVGSLAVHLQLDEIGTVSEAAITTTSLEAFRGPAPEDNYDIHTFADFTSVLLPSPDAFGNRGHDNALGGVPNTGPRVKLDEWHHLLISWDVTAGSSSHGTYHGDSLPHLSSPLSQYVTGTSTIYCAIDNVNKTGQLDLPGINVPDMPGNAMISKFTYDIIYQDTSAAAPSLIPTATVIGFPSGRPTYSVTGTITADGIYIPSELEYKMSFGTTSPDEQAHTPIEKVEMAELQIYAGVVIDTGDESLRRAFIDTKVGSTGLYPVKMSIAEEIMGRKADFILHGVGNWKSGKNTGLNQPDDNGEPTGTIKRYKPDPKIEEEVVV